MITLRAFFTGKTYLTNMLSDLPTMISLMYTSAMVSRPPHSRSTLVWARKVESTEIHNYLYLKVL